MVKIPPKFGGWFIIVPALINLPMIYDIQSPLYWNMMDIEKDYVALMECFTSVPMMSQWYREFYSAIYTIMWITLLYTLWLFNIAMENHHFEW